MLPAPAFLSRSTLALLGLYAAVLIAALAALGVGTAFRPGSCVAVATVVADRYAGLTMRNGQPYAPQAFTVAVRDHSIARGRWVKLETTEAWPKQTAYAIVTDWLPANSPSDLDLSRALMSLLSPSGEKKLHVVLTVL